jgi:hypothetical protein
MAAYTNVDITNKIIQILTNEAHKHFDKPLRQYKYIYWDIRGDHVLRNVIIDARCQQEAILKGFEIYPIDENHTIECVFESINNNYDIDSDNIKIKNIIDGKYDDVLLHEITSGYFDNDTLWIELLELKYEKPKKIKKVK